MTFSSLIKNKYSQAAATIIAIVSILGGVYAFEDRYAKTADLELVSLRLEQKIIIDRIHALQERVWMLEKHYGGPNVPNAPAPVREEYFKLKQELEDARRKIK